MVLKGFRSIIRSMTSKANALLDEYLEYEDRRRTSNGYKRKLSKSQELKSFAEFASEHAPRKGAADEKPAASLTAEEYLDKNIVHLPDGTCCHPKKGNKPNYLVTLESAKEALRLIENNYIDLSSFWVETILNKQKQLESTKSVETIDNVIRRAEAFRELVVLARKKKGEK